MNSRPHDRGDEAPDNSGVEEHLTPEQKDRRFGMAMRQVGTASSFVDWVNRIEGGEGVLDQYNEESDW